MTTANQPGRVAARRVIIWVGITLSLTLLVMMFGALRAFDTAIQPEMDKRSRLIGVTVRDGLERALELGIPLAAVAGTDAFIERTLAQFSEVRSIALVDAQGNLIALAERASTIERGVVSRVAVVGAEAPPIFTLPVLSRNTLVGEIRIEIDPTFVRTRLRDVLLDVFVVGLVSILLAFELVIFVMAGALGKPLDRILTLLRLQAGGAFGHVVPDGDAGNLRRIARRISDRAIDLASRAPKPRSPVRLPQSYFVDIRLPLFAFSVATEISSAFMPIYSRDVGSPAWMTDEFAATAPLVAYLAAIALVSPFGGTITRRFSPRILFLSSIPLTAATLVGVGLAPSALWVALWHGAMALVYAVATIAAQEYAIQTAPKGEQAQAIGSFLFVILGGAFCGSALGGVLADRIGTSGAFFVGAALAIIAGFLGYFTMSAGVAPQAEVGPAKQESSTGSGLRLLLSFRFLALIFGIGATVNIGMSVFIWYLTPVILEALGARLADIGRTVMLFFLVPVLAGPTIARLADGRVGSVPMLIGGGLLGGCALVSLSFWSGFWPVVIVVAVFGLAFGMCDATQYAHAINIARASGLPGARDAGLGALRLINRLAAIAGLFASAWLATRFDYITLSVAIGVLMLFGAVLMIAAEGSRALLARTKVEQS